jgi:quercetin dioxygenase-like cupin family protein
MHQCNRQRTRSLAAIAVASGLVSLLSTGALAGECPADKRVADGKGQPAATHSAKDVADTVRAVTDLAKEAVGINRQFRLRQLDIKPGGIVPWHSHDERPAMIYIVKGTVTEYASNCTAPIVHKAGDVAAERRGVSHWWKNTGNEAAVLISVDLFHDTAGADKKMM